MEFDPLTSPRNQTGPDMALALSTTPSYHGIKTSPVSKYHVGQPSESVGLFNSKSINDTNKYCDMAVPYSNVSLSSPDLDDSDSNSDNLHIKLDNENDLSDKDDEPIECANCNNEFPSLQCYMDHQCSRSADKVRSKNFEHFNSDSECELSDGESFDGKIVYNSDGSAYIIEGGDSDLSDLDAIIDLPQKDGIIVDKKGSNVISQVPSFPQIANAFFVSRNPSSVFNNIYNVSSHHISAQAPMMFSYKVYDVRSGKSKSDVTSCDDDNDSNSISTSESNSLITVPTKPILMCFICKLSFGYAKSFIAHATGEHSMVLNAEEKKIMAFKNASAIIQCFGKEKDPLISFLQPKPLKSSQSTMESKSLSDMYIHRDKPRSIFGNVKDTTSVSFVYSKPKLSDSLIPNSSSYSSLLPEVSSNDAKSFLMGSNPLTNFSSSLSPSLSLSVSNGAMSSVQSGQNSGKEDKDQMSCSPVSLDAKFNESSTDIITTANGKIPGDMSTSSASYSAVPSIAQSPPLLMATHQPFLGACDEHPQGRAQGVECPKCDMVLSSSQSLGGHMTMMHSRNSCKTLKCPKCNWHYKYQETLEIHMKEKHPDTDQQCMYCASNQSHPRLARGESYSCGYKPYRCEVCNYSTTTKGNLSIHMQSDKHLNNVQEMANGAELKMPPQTSTPVPDNSNPMKKNKPKPTWRCDVCNYETNVARNLRIHMTSEKHTHNMMVLQQNMKHMQHDMQIQQMNQLMLLQNDPAFLAGMTSPMPRGMGYGFDQSVMMMGNPMQGSMGEIPIDLRKENGGMGVAFDPQTPDASRLFQCCVCNTYATDSLESLHQHLQLDRTKQQEQDTVVMTQGMYLCNLCSYKTNLKANFQLHCKTDKHLQRLQLVNHIKEGGVNNEWRLKYLNVSNPVQVRCNCCDYYTNSIHKLQIHTSNPRHDSNFQLFHHLQMGEHSLDASQLKYYHCSLCNFSTRAKLNLIQHARSLRHLQSEEMKQIQMKEQGQFDLKIGDVFMVKEYDENDEENLVFDDEDGEGDAEENSSIGQDSESFVANDKKSADVDGLYNSVTTSKESDTTVNKTGTSDTEVTDQEQIHVCPYCDYSSVSEMRLQAHVVSQHTQHCLEILCPLCQEEFKDKSRLEKHLMCTHSVKSEGLQRLLLMVDHSEWIMPPTNLGQAGGVPALPIDESGEINTEVLEMEAARLAAEAIDTAALPDKMDFDDQYRCQTCSKTFANIDALYAHQNELGHLELKQTPRGPGYLCWKKGCNQYFKTAQALQVHFREIHAKRQTPSASDHLTYKFQCSQCSLAFKTPEKLQLHSQFHLIRAATRCHYCGTSFQSISALRKHVDTGHTELSESDREQYLASVNASSVALATILATSGMENIYNSAVMSSATTPNSSDNVNSIISANSMESKIENSKTDLNSNETSDKSADKEELMDLSEGVDMTSASSDSMQNHLSPDPSDTNDSLDLKYKEQQFLEDYINSQAIAEGNYEDPSRKFKCHRCKVAFTKQSYLTAHNKTLLHRKGDKMSYPMEKYLDPNRPFKCDVCKESFTQKNILLVHYNSVSHLHKLKQVSQQGPVPATTVTTTSAQQQPVQEQHPQQQKQEQQQQEQQTPVTETSTKNSQANSNATTSTSDSDKSKPYKCNICKVAYSQGSTLDIHIRSVAHQTRASKLQELVMTGEVDLSQPLIEQPNDLAKTQQQHQKILADILQQQPFLSSAALSQPSLFFPSLTTGIPGLPGIPHLSMIPGLSPVGLGLESFIPSSQPSSASKSSVQKSENPKSDDAENSVKKEHSIKEEKNYSEGEEPKIPAPSQSLSQMVNPTYLCQKCNAVFTNQDSLFQHQLMCFIQSGSSSSPITDQSQSRLRGFVGRVKPQVHRNLLENIGFECVMQFNEFSQKVVEKKENDSVEDSKEEPVEQTEEVEDKVEEKMEKMEDDPVDDSMATVTDLPEMNKCVCVTCNKEFSSVWVLKAHQEEVHKEVVPTGMVEDFGEIFKCDFEKKQPKEEATVQTEPGNIQSGGNSENNANNPEMPPPPPPQPQMSPQMDLSQMMPMFGLGMPMPIPFSMAVAMNMQPPLMPMMFPMTTESSATLPTATSPATNDSNLNSLQKQQLVQQAVALQNQKRARTRINDEQLKVLRAHFDINNSPSEEQILAMAEQSGLPTKVIKHWFRNTLFKERQRNKDSPYNFNNPPSTTLDLEEYEKTGKLAIAEEKDICLDIKKEPEDLLPEDNDDSMFMPQSSHSFSETNESYVNESYVTTPITAPTEIKPETAKIVQPPSSQSPELSSSPGLFSAMSTPSVPSTPTMSFPLTPVTSHYDDMRLKIDTSPHHHSSYSRRANRTRFTDYQIKVLQEYFEQNAYPKDDELDHLSQLLNLSPRVIVVWFQNARQKARKIYENQPQADVKEMSSSPFPRTPGGLNYQCKKCSSVFQRYYDLIRHQKKCCGLDGDKHGTSRSSTQDDFLNSDSLSLSSRDDSDFEDSDNISLNSNDVSHSSEKNISDGIKYKCEKCELSFERFEQWQEHQNVHSLNPNLFSNLANNSAFGVLQSMAAAQQQQDKGALYKRKVDDDQSDEQDEQPRDKRLRTTILPEQLDYLYQKYQVDCNPSRKQLESISSDVGLKKRVVQVWFQNTRARERKGQYRAHQQLIHKRCPFCRALFRAKSAMESHLATKHPEEMAKGEINVDNIPDAAIESPGHPSSILSPSSTDISKLLSPPGMQSFLPIMPPNSLSLGMNMLGADPLQLSMKQIYEDTLKQYMNDLSSVSGHKEPMREAAMLSHSKHHDSHTSATKSSNSNEDDAPLDLSKPLKVNTSDTDKGSDGPSTDKSERSYDDHYNISRRRESLDDSISETYSNHESDNFNDSLNISTSRPGSPMGSLASNSSKRYRTQMTSVQVRIMKHIFVDYKTPTMAECEMLGRDIGLPKRVVQVWFQNARAKEKKAKLNMAKSFGGPDMDFTKPPEECSLCKFKYSHKYTIQDHIFTRKHLEKIKSYIQSQSDAEREITTSQSALVSSLGGHQQQEIDRMRKVWDEAAAAASVQPHLAQLQAMGLGALGMPPAGIPGLGTPFNPADVLREKKLDSKKDTEEKETDKTKNEKVKKEPSSSESQLGSLMSLQGFLPGLDPNLLSYMSYAGGMPGYMPGMGMGMPFLQPGFMPGAEQLLAYDPLTFGTPLPLLQIPPQAIKDVSIKLSEPKATVAQYTQDCKSISSLRSLVNSVDYNCVREATVDVGYICKKCQMVYPAKDACISHQRAICFPGGKVPDNIMPWLKLEQIQYECRLCCDKFSTVHEYKAHCQMEAHKVKVTRLHHKTSSSSTTSPSKSASSSGHDSAHRSHSSPAKSLLSSSSSISSMMPKAEDKSSIKGSVVKSEIDIGPESKKMKVE